MATNSLTLTWTAATGTAPITYQPQYRVSGTTTWTPFGSPISALTVVITGLVASTRYDFDVIASNAYGSATTGIVSDATNSGNAFPAPNAVAGSQNSGSALPVMVGPQNGAAYTGAALPVTGITIADSAASGTVTLKVTCTSGTLGMTLSGTAVTGSGTNSITFANTLANCQTVIGTLIYTAPASPTTDTITVTFTDQISEVNTLLIQIQVTTQVVATAPNAPTGLTAGTASNTSIQLNWVASTVGTAPITYQPMFKLATAPSYAAFGSPVSGLTATVTGLTAATNYNFEIVASNSAGSATSSAITASTTNATVAPNAPTNLTVTQITSTSLTYSWSPSSVGSPTILYQPMVRPSGVGSFYQFGVDPWTPALSAAFGPLAIAPITGTSIAVTGLAPTTSYDLEVIASNSVGSATSSAITSTTGSPGVPSDGTGTRAKPAQDMLNRIGINTHFGNGNYSAFTTAQGVAAIQSIGITLIRDSDNG